MIEGAGVGDVRVSVVMSVYNADRYLEQAVKSILDQTLEAFEFIVIDDGSTDGSRSILRSFSDERLVIIEQSNQGLPKALNRGITRARSPLIARMDADDIALPSRLQEQVDFLDRNPEHVGVGSNAFVIDEYGRYVYTTNEPRADESLRSRLPETPFIHPSSMFRKEAFEAAGGYCEQMFTAQDTVLFNRMMRWGKVANLAKPLIKYRIVPTAITKRGKVSRTYSRIMRRAILENRISSEDAAYLLSNWKQRRPQERAVAYHTFLAKKLLWNSHRPGEAREHLLASLATKPTLETALLYGGSFLPEAWVKQGYRQLKRWSGAGN